MLSLLTRIHQSIQKSTAKKCALYISILWLLYRVFLKREKKLKNVQGQVVLITGAASGFGRIFAERFAQLGAKLALLDINLQGLQSTADSLDLPKERFVLIPCDITNTQALIDALHKIRSTLGPVDILLNNAGAVNGKPLDLLTPQEIHKVVDINLTSPMILASLILPQMIERGEGHIVNVCSAGGIIGVGRLTEYCATKAGLRTFGQALHEELRTRPNQINLADKIRITSICPYFSGTGMFDGVRTVPVLLPLMNPSDVVDRAMKGILREEHEVLMPFLVSLSPLLMVLLPYRLKCAFSDFLKLGETMSNFRGRQPAALMANAII